MIVIQLCNFAITYHVFYTRCFVVLCLTLIIRLVLEDLYLDLIYLQTSVWDQLGFLFKNLSSPLLVPPMSCNLWNSWFCIVVHCASAAHQEGMFLSWYTSFLKESNCSVYSRSADTSLSMYHSMCELPSNLGKALLSYAAIFFFFDIFAFWHSHVLSARNAGAKVVKIS